MQQPGTPGAQQREEQLELQREQQEEAQP
jgi:hypothetical protein